MKKCPYCAEEIQDEAIVCCFCNSNLEEASSNSSYKTKKKWTPLSYYRWSRAVDILFVASMGILYGEPPGIFKTARAYFAYFFVILLIFFIFHFHLAKGEGKRFVNFLKESRYPDE